MSSPFAEAARRMSGQILQSARGLSWRARYTSTPDGLSVRRNWRARWDNLVHPRRTAEREVGDRMRNGPPGQALAEKAEELRPAREQAEWERLHGLTPYLTGPTPWEHGPPPEVDLGPEMTEEDIERQVREYEIARREIWTEITFSEPGQEGFTTTWWPAAEHDADR